MTYAYSLHSASDTRPYFPSLGGLLAKTGVLEWASLSASLIGQDDLEIGLLIQEVNFRPSALHSISSELRSWGHAVRRNILSRYQAMRGQTSGTDEIGIGTISNLCKILGHEMLAWYHWLAFQLGLLLERLVGVEVACRHLVLLTWASIANQWRCQRRLVRQQRKACQRSAGEVGLLVVKSRLWLQTKDRVGIRFRGHNLQ